MARKGYEQHGPLPTIARFREHEVRQLLVICITANGGYQCHHEGEVPLAGLPDVDLLTLRRMRKFRCSKCGGTNVELRPNWASRPSEKKGEPARGWIIPPEFRPRSSEP